ncbi:hypothetical protein M8C21_030884, partial [Ambrosia artemisiifolia]
MLRAVRMALMLPSFVLKHNLALIEVHMKMVQRTELMVRQAGLRSGVPIEFAKLLF